MGSNEKKNSRNRNSNVNRQNTNSAKDNKYITTEVDESDKIIEQLDAIEKLKENTADLEKEDVSSRVRNMLKSDKEAIRKMREQMAKLDEDDELDYLDDEKIDLPMGAKDTDEKEANNDKKSVTSVKEKNNKTSNNKKNRKNNKNDIKEDRSENNKKGENKVVDIEKNSQQERNAEKDVNLDFFENMAREDEIHYNKIRKSAPNRLKKNSDAKIKEYFTNSVRNIAIVTTIAMLLVVMFIALFSIGKKDKEVKNYNFIEIDETGFIETINNYYNSLGTGNVNDIRKYIYEAKKLSDADILKLTEEQMFLLGFYFNEILEKPFEITDCYVLEGMKKKEYIVLMKYQFTLKDCTEPAPGIFTWYMVDVSMSDTPVYKISTKVGDTSSYVHKYVCEMENTNLVTDLVEDVNEELIESCKKDEVLRKIILNIYDKMVKSGDKIDNSFRKIIVELKEYEENN